MNRCNLILIFWLKTCLVYCQYDGLIKSFQDSIADIETISYTARMLTKKFSSDEFKEKNFEVYARRNPSNTGYNFDWEIVEDKGESEQRYLFVGKEFFYINKEFKVIGYVNNIKNLPTGNYFESMRWSTLFNELLYNFGSIYKENKVELLPGSEKHWQLKIEINGTEDRYLIINRGNLFPEKARNIVRYKELNLTQIIETNLSNIKLNSTLPDTVLSPQYYLNQEYSVKYQEYEKEAGAASSVQYFTLDQLDYLFKTTLVSSTGDTTNLGDIDANLMLIYFWYMSCVPCLKSLPYLQELEVKYKSKGFKVIGVNCHDTDNKEYVIGKLKEKGVSYSNFFGDKSILNQLNINTFPTFIILNRSQRVFYTGVGTGKDFEPIIEEVLKN